MGDERPVGLRWPTSEVRYVVNERGSVDFPSADGKIAPELLDTIHASFEAWNEPDCSPFTFVSDGLTEVDAFSRSDGLNVVVFLEDDWPYGSMVVAITTITGTNAGEITNADMELNGFEHDFAIVASNSTAWDVQNTITHEAGHVLGLDHDAVPNSTMEFEAQPGETKKRDLHPDDIEGLCMVYPPVEEMEPPDAPPDKGCCSTARSSRASSFFGLLLLAVAALARRGLTRYGGEGRGSERR